MNIQLLTNKYFGNEKIAKTFIDKIKSRLFDLGYKFPNDNAFFDFCKDRITEVSDKKKVNLIKLYLDYENSDYKGFYLTSFFI